MKVFRQLIGRKLYIVFGLVLTFAFISSGFLDFGKLFSSSAATESSMLVPNISATLADSFADADMDGKAAPGEVVTYTATINNAGTDATGVQFFDTLDNVATLVPGSLHASPIANNDSFNAVGNTLLEVGVAASGFPAVMQAGTVLSNDTAVTDTISIVSNTNPTNGSVTLNSNGTFSYLPNANFTGPDTFTYTIRNNAVPTLTDTGSVSINVSSKVWYVNNSGANGTGRSNSPFNNLTSANTASATGDIIFVHRTVTNYTTGITLKNTQQLIGQGVNLVVDTFTLITATTNPTLAPAAGNGITLASGNTIRGLNVSSGGSGIVGSNVGNLTINTASASATGGPGVDIQTGGTLAVTLRTLASSSSAFGLRLTNTSGTFTVTGDGSTGTQGGNDTGGIIQNTTGDGVVLNNANGITLQNMTIGDPTATPANGPDAIANIAGDGIQVTGTSNGLTLNNVTIARTGDHGVNAANHTNLTVNNSLVLNAGNGQEEHGLNLDEQRGDNFVTGSLFDAFNETGIELINASGSVDLTVNNTIFQDNKATVGNAGEEAILIEAQGSASIVALITGTAGPTTQSIFDDIALQSIDVKSPGTSSNVELTVENSRFLESGAGDAVIIMNPDNAGNGNVTVKNNFFTDDTLGPFALLAKNDSSGTLDVTVQGNTVTKMQLLSVNHDNIGSGVANGTTRTLIGGSGAGEGNMVTVGSENIGIDMISTDDAADTNLDLSATILNNTVTLIEGAFSFTGGIRIEAQNTSRVNVDIRGNTANGTPACCGGQGMYMRTLDTSQVGIAGLTGAAEAYVNGLNTFTPQYAIQVGFANFVAGTPAAPVPTTRPNPLYEPNPGISVVKYGFAESGADAVSVPQSLFKLASTLASMIVPTAAAQGKIDNRFINQRPPRLAGETVNTMAFNLAAGKSVMIVFQATVADPNGATSMMTQGLVSGTNFGNVLTDDPGTGAPSDPTVTPLALTPTAADATISGRVISPAGRGLSGVRVIISGGNLTESHYTQTNPFGYFRFVDLEVGATYVITVSAKNHIFANPNRVVNLEEDIVLPVFVSEP